MAALCVAAIALPSCGDDAAPAANTRRVRREGR
jgi:hypothetical protein